MKGNTVGSRSDIEKAYIAGFLDGEGSVTLQIEKRNGTSGPRFTATICFYQDTRHDKALYWIRDVYGMGQISVKDDGMTELRIKGLRTVQSILEELQPYVRFKKLQVEAIMSACRILQRNFNVLSIAELQHLCTLVLLVENENYQSQHKKSEVELHKIFGLTP